MTTHAPFVSIVIPCYNQGQYIDDAVKSILEQSYQDFEIIIVNDGSTEVETVEILKVYNKPRTRVVHTQNQGLSSARNCAIELSNGKYILPLDADDKIGNTYIEEAVRLLENNDNLGIVYCEAEFFGDMAGKWELNNYNFPDILLGNMIFCSGFFRKSDWKNVKGYNAKMIYGWEDYDFWLSIIELGREVYRIPKILFFYRRKSNSMTAQMDNKKFIYSYTQIFENHPRIYSQNVRYIFAKVVEARIENSHLQCELQNYAGIIKSMESTKFWKLRQAYVRFKDFSTLLFRSCKLKF